MEEILLQFQTIPKKSKPNQKKSQCNKHKKDFPSLRNNDNLEVNVQLIHKVRRKGIFQLNLLYLGNG